MKFGVFPNVDNIRWTITVLWIRSLTSSNERSSPDFMESSLAMLMAEREALKANLVQKTKPSRKSDGSFRLRLETTAKAIKVVVLSANSSNWRCKNTTFLVSATIFLVFQQSIFRSCFDFFSSLFERDFWGWFFCWVNDDSGLSERAKRKIRPERPSKKPKKKKIKL